MSEKVVVPLEVKPFIDALRRVCRSGLSLAQLEDSPLIYIEAVSARCDAHSSTADRVEAFKTLLREVTSQRLLGREVEFAKRLFALDDWAGVSTRARYEAVAKLYGKRSWDYYRREPLTRFLYGVYLALARGAEPEPDGRPVIVRRTPTKLPDDQLASYCHDVISRYSEWGGDRYISLIARPVSAPDARSVDAHETIGSSNRLILLGDSGSGKSTVIERMAWESATHFAGNPEEELIPVVVPLLQYGGDLRTSIRAALNHAGHLGVGTVDIEDVLSTTSCLFLLDGLNEVPESRRDIILPDLLLFMDTFGRHRYVIACRTNDQLWQMIPQSAVDQRFVLEPVQAEHAVSYLARHLGDWFGRLAYFEMPRRLRDLLSSPVLLWMFKEGIGSIREQLDSTHVPINEFNQRLGELTPRNRAEMYAQFVEAMLARELTKGPSAARTSTEVKRSVLTALALDLQTKHTLAVPRTEAVECIRDAQYAEGDDTGPAVVLRELRLNGLLHGDELVQFSHQSFQEFFAALSMVNEPPLKGAGKAADPWWSETIVFVAGLLPSDQREQLVSAVAEVDVELAFRCTTETGGDDLTLSRVLATKLEALLQNDSWVERRRAIELLGLLQDDSVVPSIVAGLADHSEEVRWQAASALRNHGGSEAADALQAALTDPAWAVRSRAAEALGRLGAREAAPLLAPLLDASMPRERADATFALTLMRLGSGDPEIRDLLAHPTARVRDSARLATEVTASDDRNRHLRGQLGVLSANRRQKAAYLLTRFGAIEAIDDIAQLLDDEDDDVVIIAMQSLAELYAVEHFDRVLALAAHPTPFVRVIAAVCSQLFGFRSAIPHLVPMLGDPDPEVRYAATRTLGELDAADASGQILPLLNDPAEKVRWQAAYVLGSLGDPASMSALETARDDSSQAVREAVESAILRLSRHQSSPHGHRR